MPSLLPPEPLTADPTRDASASMGGYWAQVWRSVLVWLSLGDEERLFLEGAEDFDRIGPLGAEAVQVKNVVGNVTLRSQDAIDAIGHAWEHRQRNPDRAVRFRFLSIGGIGVEHRAPFGAGLGGLQLWRDARVSQDPAFRMLSARKLADFLLAEGKLTNPVQTFIRGATDDVLWAELIAPLDWDLDAATTTEVVAEVKDALVVLGQTLSVSAPQAELVAEHLCAHANETATRQKDRILTRADLLRLFAEKTRISLPAAFADQLFAALERQFPGAGAVPTAIGGAAVAISRPAPAPPRYFARVALLEDIDGRLSRRGALVLEGGTGVGKSTAAAGYVAAAGAPWGWVDLRGAETQTLANILHRVSAELVVDAGLAGLVLDDITLPADPRPLEAGLARIKAVLGARGGRLIITSAAPWPQRLRQTLDLDVDGVLGVEHFARAEIEAYLLDRGCPPESAPTWAGFIELHTLGHAQLVHARVATLQSDGFPEPILEDLPATPHDIAEARTEARRLVSTLAPSARDLVYRLSLMTVAFTRPQVMAIAALAPPIDEPGLVLDSLVGPWLEVIIDGLYRTSPLLQGMGGDVNGSDWALDAHRNIGRALSAFRTVTPTDVSAILYHATASRDWGTIARMSYGLLRADGETWSALAESLAWFTLIGTGAAANFVQADPFSRFLFRLLQYRIAAARAESDKAAQIWALFDAELPSDTTDDPLLMARYFFLATVLMRSEVAVPLATFVDIGLEYIVLSDRFAVLLEEAASDEFDRLMAGPDGRPDKAGVAGYSLTAHLSDRAGLDALLTACEGRDESALRRLLWFVGGRETTGGIILDRAWLDEGKAIAPDWSACRASFERVYAFAQRLSLPGLAHAAARNICRLVAMNLKDRPSAIALADAFAAEIGWSPGLENEKASVLLDSGSEVQALSIWRRLLPTWTARDEFDLQITHSNRLAAIAAARLDLWAEAADWLKTAQATAGHDQGPYHAGLIVDEAYARWKAGNTAAALDRLVAGVSAIDALAPDAIDRKAFMVRKRAGHVIMYMARAAAGHTLADLLEPPPATCSLLEVLDTPDLPPTSSDGLWSLVVEFELEADLGDAILRVHENHLRASPFGLVRMSFGMTRIRQRLRALTFADFVEVAADWTEAFALCRLYYMPGGLSGADPLPEGTPPVDPIDLDVTVIKTVLLNAVFALTARAEVTDAMIADWRASADRAGLLGEVAGWLDFMGQALVARSVNVRLAVQSAPIDWTWGIIANLQLAADSDVTADELFGVHINWIRALRIVNAAFFALGDVEALITRQWLALSLRNPEVTITRLAAAFANPASGWPKIGQVLLAASDLLPAPADADIVAELQALLSL